MGPSSHFTGIYEKGLLKFNVFVNLGGLDLDQNNHTDILVGAFESDAAVIIR